jgi:hypothetical protein
MWLNKGIETGETGETSSGFRHPASGVLEGPVRFSNRNQASGVIVPIIVNFTVLLFYFFEKKKCWNIGTFRLTLLILLKLLHKIEVKCSRKVKYARTVGIKHFFTYDF